MSTTITIMTLLAILKCFRKFQAVRSSLRNYVMMVVGGQNVQKNTTTQCNNYFIVPVPVRPCSDTSCNVSDFHSRQNSDLKVECDTCDNMMRRDSNTCYDHTGGATVRTNWSSNYG